MKEIDYNNPQYRGDKYIGFWDCPQCNKVGIIEDANYCYKCGEKINWINKEETQNAKDKKMKEIDLSDWNLIFNHITQEQVDQIKEMNLTFEQFIIWHQLKDAIYKEDYELAARLKGELFKIIETENAKLK